MDVRGKRGAIIEDSKVSSLGNWVGDRTVNANREFKRGSEFG